MRSELLHWLNFCGSFGRLLPLVRSAFQMLIPVVTMPRPPHVKPSAHQSLPSLNELMDADEFTRLLAQYREKAYENLSNLDGRLTTADRLLHLQDCLDQGIIDRVVFRALRDELTYGPKRFDQR